MISCIPGYESIESQMIICAHFLLLRPDKRILINVPTNSIYNKCYRGFIMLIGRPARGSRDADLRRYTHICIRIYTRRFADSDAISRTRDYASATSIKMTLNTIMR